MDWQAWKTALGLYVSTPELMGASVVVAIAIFAFAWWLRGHFTQGQIKALGGQLQLARDQYDAVNRQLTEVRSQVATQENVISGLRNALPPPARVEELARSNTEIQQALISLAAYTGTLGHTLTLADGRY